MAINFDCIDPLEFTADILYGFCLGCGEKFNFCCDFCQCFTKGSNSRSWPSSKIYPVCYYSLLVLCFGHRLRSVNDEVFLIAI